MTSPIQYLEDALSILRRDEPRLSMIDHYFKGDHALPYMPDSADQEYFLLAKRAITNWCPLLVSTPAQALYVDNFRRSSERSIDADVSPEWRHWQESRMDARQAAVYASALEFGHSFVLTRKNEDGKVISQGLSPLRTVTLYDDPAIDLDPIAGVYIKRWPRDVHLVREDVGKAGEALVYDEENFYEIEFWHGDREPEIVSYAPHGASQCPITRFTAYVDLEGRAWGVVEPIIPLQDRINQTIFDLLVAQTYNSFNVRWVTGMAPPFQMQQDQDGTWVPKVDDEGNPIADKQYLNASRFFYAQDDNVKFGQLTGGDLKGFIDSAELAIRHLSATTQTPPHFLLGQIANVAAEALEAAETSLMRKVEEFRNSFGESWERVFRIALEMLDEAGEDDYLGEVIWRDLTVSSLSQVADGLGKFAESLEIPKKGLWSRVPGVTRQEIREWSELADEQDRELQIMQKALGPIVNSGAATGQRFGASATQQMMAGNGQSAAA